MYFNENRRACHGISTTAKHLCYLMDLVLCLTEF